MLSTNPLPLGASIVSTALGSAPAFAMKPRVWFALSLAANVVLLAVVLWTNSIPSHPAASNAAKNTPLQPPPTRTSSSEPQAAPLGWEDSMAQFRQAGVPSSILAKLVVEKIALKWTPLEKQLEQQYLHDQIDAKRLAEMHDLRELEQEQELRLALGDGYAAWDKQFTVDNMYLGGLTPTNAERDALYPLQKDYLKRLHDLEVSRRNGQLDEISFADAQQQTEDTYKNQLASIIGPDRVDGIKGNENPAVQLRRDFSRLQLNNAQINELAAIQQKWTAARASMSQSLDQTKTIDVAYEGDLQAIDRARDDEFRRILGEEPFDAWQKSRDDRYNALKRNAAGLSLNQQQVDGIYNVLRSYDLAAATFEHQAQVLAQQGKPVDWASVDKSLTAYAQQTEESLRRYLGSERFALLQKSQIFSFQKTPSADHNLENRISIR